MSQVILENIYKSFPKNAKDSSSLSGEENLESHAILRRINLSINPGEFMVLVGPSGCGKSTLLRLIAGLETLTAGHIWIGEKLINNIPPKARNIAMVFQSYALYPHLNVYNNLAFGLRRNHPSDQSSSFGDKILKNITQITKILPPGFRYLSEEEKQIEIQVKKVAQLLQIETLLGRFPKQLSGGQKQRVALGRAIVRNPQVFLMDEPLSNLDAKLRTETRTQIVQLQKKLGITTIYVTHDQVEAMTMGSRIAVMNQGQIQQVAEPMELYHYPTNRFVAEFIGSPPMNFLTVKLGGGGTLINHPLFRMTLPDTWKEVLKNYEGKSLILGIRPEDLSVSPPATKNLPVQVEMVEALGHETLLSVSFIELMNGENQQNSVKMQVRITPDRTVKVGDKLWLAIGLEKMHFFDPDTELAIRF